MNEVEGVPPPPSVSGEGRLGRAGGWLLLGSGLVIVGGCVALTVTADPSSQGWAFFFAPLFLAIGALPLSAGIGAVRRHRKAQFIGAIIGWLYGGIVVLTWFGASTGSPANALGLVVSLPFLFGALFLTLAVSRHEV